MPRDDDALQRLYGDTPPPVPTRVGGVSLVWVGMVIGLGAVGVAGMLLATTMGLRPDPVSDRLVELGVIGAGEIVTLMYGTPEDGCLITPDAMVTWDEAGATRASLIDAVVSEERLPHALVVTSDTTVRCVFTDDVSYSVFSELVRRGVRPTREAWRTVDPRLQ
ncbi:MAG: hypothetical protein ACJATT_003029 [Myxococcota bacterium]|jgi:hypothetical protein